MAETETPTTDRRSEAKTAASTRGGTGTKSLERTGRSELVTDQGKTSIADSVVSKIAGVATREISGVHDMGKSTSRIFGAVRERIPAGSNSPNPSQGVSVEVDGVVDYGVSIPDLAQAVRQNVIECTERMTGLEVTEVNVSIDDVWLGEEEEEARVE